MFAILKIKTIQHPLAEVEIVAWDSSKTMLISRRIELTDKFIEGFPESEDLNAQNRRDNAEIAYIQELVIMESIKLNVTIDEKLLDKKYLIWNKLYSDRDHSVNDSDIIRCINEVLS